MLAPSQRFQWALVVLTLWLAQMREVGVKNRLGGIALGSALVKCYPVVDKVPTLARGTPRGWDEEGPVCMRVDREGGPQLLKRQESLDQL